MVVETILNPVLSPLKINPTITIILIALIMSLIITIMNKYLVDQNKAKEIKKEIKELQAKLKQEPDKFGEIHKKIMSKTKDQFKLTIKSMLLSLPIALIIFAWLSTSAAYEQIEPNQEFNVLIEFEKEATNKNIQVTSQTLEVISNTTIEENLQYKLKGPEGKHTINYQYGDETYEQEVLITPNWEYLNNPLQKTTGFIISFGTGDIQETSQIKKITTQLNPVKPLGNLSIFGWHPGWIASYLLFSIIFTIALRKIFKTQI